MAESKGLKEFRLPDVGEGLTEADIVAWHVKPGDTVEVNQTIVEIETAKAVVELPSPWDGTVARLLAEEGQTVDVGVPIIAIDVGEQAAVAPEPAAVQATAPPETEPPQRQAVLVGYGVKASSTTRRPRKTPATPSAAAARPEAVRALADQQSADLARSMLTVIGVAFPFLTPNPHWRRADRRAMLSRWTTAGRSSSATPSFRMPASIPPWPGPPASPTSWASTCSESRTTRINGVSWTPGR